MGKPPEKPQQSLKPSLYVYCIQHNTITEIQKNDDSGLVMGKKLSLVTSV